MLELKLLNSLEKVFIDSDLTFKDYNDFLCLKNEPMNFQLAYRLVDEKITVPFYIKVETDLPITMYSVGYVPVLGVENGTFEEKYKSGLFPDILNPKKVNPEIVDAQNPHVRRFVEKDETNYLRAHNYNWQTLWICINESQKDIKSGDYKIKFSFLARRINEELGEITANVRVVDAKLPPQKTFYTNWFHCDCLADIYRVEMFSDEFFKIFENFVKTAANNGMNMILTPAFTPALDTGVGLERKKAQLVRVIKDRDNYTFDFTLLKRYIDICRKAGIKFFEHSHLYTQWGVKNSPNIYAEVGGKEKRIFGWETDACDPKYAKFLRQYLTALKVFLKEEKLEKKILFHISDEPTDEDAPNYKRAKAQIIDLVDEYMMGDALSHYELYSEGLVKTPIVSINKIGDFLGKCDNFWAYYTGGEQGRLSNRLLINSLERTRMIGVQMYYHNVKGFLHWGYNYYYDLMSNGLFDPRVNTEGYNTLAGTTYSVYPNPDGTALQSIRQKVFFEGLNDIRILSLLEKLYDRNFVKALIEKHFGKVITFETEAKNPAKFMKFRREVGELIDSKTN